MASGGCCSGAGRGAGGDAGAGVDGAGGACCAEAGAGEWVLSVQSSVVHGYVGNKSAVFPLQLLGFEVDPLNSVQLSNHTGYAAFAGAKMQGEDLEKLAGGMRANGFFGRYTRVLTGYMGSVSFLRAAAGLVREVREATGGRATYLCDPVMGDNGRLYVPEEFVAVYRDELVPLAETVTPNQTEAELLTGVRIRTAADAYQACCLLHAMGPRNVVITSLELASSGGGVIDIVATEAGEGGAPPAEYLHLQVPLVEGYLSGTGDLAAALLMAGLARGRPLARVLEESVAAVQAVIRRTHAAGRRELALVQSRGDLEAPAVEHHARRCPPPRTRVVQSEEKGRCLEAGRDVYEGDNVLIEGPRLALPLPRAGGRRGALVCAECAGMAGSLADQLRWLAADPSSVPDALPCVDPEVAQLSSGVFPCGADGCDAVYCSERCRDAAREAHHALLCGAAEFRRHAARVQPQFLLAARVMASYALGKDLLPRSGLGGLVARPYWEVAVDAFDVEEDEDEEEEEDAEEDDRKEGDTEAAMAALRERREAELRESWALLLPVLKAAGAADDDGDADAAWRNVETYARVAGALRLNNVAVDYASPLAAYFALIGSLDGAAAAEAVRVLLPAVRSVQQRAALEKAADSDGEEEEEEEEDDDDDDDDSDEDEIEVEAVELEWEGVRFSTALFPHVAATGLFERVACVNHSCVPNAEVEFNDPSGRASLTMLRDVPAGEELTIGYVYEGLDAEDRAKALAPYGFVCNCPRCEAGQ